METLNQLAKAALLGNIEVPALPGQASELPLPPDADGMLMAAGVLSLYREAGFAPAEAKTDLPIPSAEETLAAATQQADILFQTILDTEFPALIRLALQHWRNRGWRVPATVLPRLLKLGAQQQTLQSLIQETAGQRGRWLARRNPEWQYSRHDKIEEAQWEEGTITERQMYLHSLRQHDPDTARDKLATSFAGETAKHRGMLLATLADGLSMRDEAFLHDVLNDRSKDVAKAAAGLLSRLPESRLSQQARVLLNSCLGWKGMLKKYWELEPPETFTPELKALAIQEDAKFGQNIGQRAGWLVQLVSIAPLDWWTETLKATPAELYTQAKKSQWTAALRLGWDFAVTAQHNAAWAKSLIEAGHLGGHALFLLGAEDFEAVMLVLIKQDAKHFSTHFKQLLDTTLKQQRCWSEIASRDILRAVQQHILHNSHAHYDYEFRRAFPAIACALHSTVLPDALDNWPRDAAHWVHFLEVFADFTRFVRLRMELPALK